MQIILRRNEQTHKVIVVPESSQKSSATLTFAYSPQYGFIDQQLLQYREFSGYDQIKTFSIDTSQHQGTLFDDPDFGRCTYLVSDSKDFENILAPEWTRAREQSDRFGRWMAVALAILIVLVMATRWGGNQILAELEEPPKPIEEVAPPPIAVVMRPIISNQSAPQTKTAAAQTVGFLGLLGKQDLKKALGGLPTHPGASPGAGTGGNEGSGGESLAAMGSGLSNVSIGNGGVRGLGGVGTKGKGGGGGGYGNVELAGTGGTGLGFQQISQQVTLEGGLSADVIRATIARYLSQIRNCYEQGLQQQPGLQGRVLTDFVIAGDGAMKAVQIASTTLRHAGVEKCITQRMMDWKFPTPKGGVETKVKYPFVLHPTKG